MSIGRGILFSFFLLFNHTLSANDSLWNIFNDENRSYNERMLALDDLVWETLFEDPDSGYRLALYELEVGQKMNSLIMQGNAQQNIGVYYFLSAQYDTAIHHYILSLDVRTRAGDKKGMASSLNNLGIVYEVTSNYLKAIESYQQSILLYEELKDTLGMSKAYHNISNIYQELEEYEKAVEYTSKSMELCRLMNDEQCEASIGVNTGILYMQMGETEKALEYYYESNRLCAKNNDVRCLIRTQNNLALHFIQTGEVEKAHEYAELAFKNSIATNDLEGELRANTNLGRVYLLRNEYQKSAEHTFKALEISQQIGFVTVEKDAYEILYKLKKKRGMHDEALRFYEKYIFLRDSLNKEAASRELTHKQYQFEYEKKASADSIRIREEKRVINAELDAKKTQSYALIGGLMLMILFGGVTYNRFRITRRQKQTIEQQKLIVEHQKDIVDEKNKEILDSIMYAKRLQDAILPPARLINDSFNDAFILYKPKDIVAGDFYFMESVRNEIIVAAGDCTGHGVPGAMVSVVCSNALNRTVKEFGITEPGLILDKVRELVIETFSKSASEVKDGMDIALFTMVSTGEGFMVKYAGANNPLWVIRNGEEELLEIKGNKQPVGYVADPQLFLTHELLLKKGDLIYIFTDGYEDQFGGEKGKKFKSANLKKLLLSISSLPMEKQKQILDDTFEGWRNTLEQVDDVCLMGFRL